MNTELKTILHQIKNKACSGALEILKEDLIELTDSHINSLMIGWREDSDFIKLCNEVLNERKVLKRKEKINSILKNK